MINDIIAALDRAGDAARHAGMVATQIEHRTTDPTAIATCAMILNAVGLFRDQLASIRLDALKGIAP